MIRKILREGQDEAIHRSEIARRVCIALGWRNARGDLKEMGARAALLRLYRQGWITFPEPRNGNGNRGGGADRFACAPVPEPPASDLCCALSELGSIQLRKVENKHESLLWDGMIDRYHYLGHSPLSGAQIRYLIDSEHSNCLALPSSTVSPYRRTMIRSTS